VQIPANSQSQLPSKLADLPAFQKSNVDKFIDVDYDLVGKNNAAWTERWNSDIVSKI
jgi:putative spermidine/putrescine transport system substrate-binding protein